MWGGRGAEEGALDEGCRPQRTLRLQRQVPSHEPSLHPLLLRPQRVFHRTERAREEDVARITPVARIAALAPHADVARAADARVCLLQLLLQHCTGAPLEREHSVFQ